MVSDDVSVGVGSSDGVDGLFIPVEVLKNYGCRGCVWKATGECPHGLTGVEVVELGYCDKLVDFLVSLDDGSGSLSGVKEQFHLYVQELQTMTDRAAYIMLLEELRLFRLRENEMDPSDFRKGLKKLESQVHSYKTWWHRLSDSVVKGYGRVKDRESRSKDAHVIGGAKLDLTQIHTIMVDARKRLEDKKDE